MKELRTAFIEHYCNTIGDTWEVRLFAAKYWEASYAGRVTSV